MLLAARPSTSASRPLAFCLALACATGAASTAGAQTEQEVATRRLLLDRADAARNGGRHAEALDLYTRAGRIQMSPSVRGLIAEEQLRTGALAEALGSADLCLSELGASTAVRQREAIEAHCRALRDDLRQRVGELVVVVPTPTPAGLRVTVAERELSPVLYGMPAATTPGTVEVVATVGGVAQWRGSVTVVARETATARVVLPAPAPLPPAATPTPSVTPTPPAQRTRSRRAPPREVTVDRGRGLRTLGAVTAGLAGASMIAGTVALVVQRGRASDFNAQRFPIDACDQTCASQRAGVESAATAAWAGYIIGAVLGVGGVALLVGAPSTPRPSTALRSCGPMPGTAGLSCVIGF